MCDDRIPGSTVYADRAPVETRTRIEERIAASEQEAVAVVGAGPSSPRPSQLDMRELRHEVRNALTAAAGYAQWLQHRSACWTDERERRALDTIQQGIARAISLLQDHRTQELSPPVELRHLVAEAVSQVPPLRIGDMIVRILTMAPLTGTWDGEKIVQVLVNLLDNAAKYSPPGTPIIIELTREAEHARICVRDQGIGIEADALAAIFDGYRTQLARTTAEGSGIGLQLCRRLVHAEGGQLGVTSQPGRGSTFWVTLPLAPQARQATSEQARGN